MENQFYFLSKRIKNLREQKKLTQQEFGALFGSPKQTVWNWEKGLAAPTISLLCKISDHFNISIDYLVGRTDDPNPKVSCELANELTSLDEGQLKAVKAFITTLKLTS